MPLFDVISSFFSTPAAARVGIRLADAEISGAVRINAHNAADASGTVEIQRRRRRRRSRSAAAAPANSSTARSATPARGGAASRRRSPSRNHQKRSRSRSAHKKTPHSAGKKPVSHKRSPRRPATPVSRRMEFCVQDEASMRNADPAVRAAAIARAKELGATHIRMMLYMHDLHPCRGSEAADRLAIYEAAVREAQAAGLKVQLVLTGVASPWGTPTKNGSPCARPPGINPSVKGYGEYVKQMVKHFSAMGVHRYSLWNEPNLPGFLCAGTKVSNNGDIDKTKCVGSSVERTASLFSRLYKKGYSVIRELERSKSIPKTQILMGELAPTKTTSRFLSAVFHPGAKFEADGFAVHPYQYCTPPDTHKNEYVKNCECDWPAGQNYGIAWAPQWQERLQSLHRRGRLSTPRGNKVPLYLTEFGYHLDGHAALPEDVRAKWYPRAMSEAARAGAKGMNIYQIFNGSGAPNVWDTGLIAQGNVPRPSFNALKDWAKKNGYKTQ